MNAYVLYTAKTTIFLCEQQDIESLNTVLSVYVGGVFTHMWCGDSAHGFPLRCQYGTELYEFSFCYTGMDVNCDKIRYMEMNTPYVWICG